MGARGLVTPKVLLPVGGRPLVSYHFANLVRAGITEIVMNVHHLADQIIEALGNGAQYGVSIQYSHETNLYDTGGGIFYALPLLGMEPFIVIGGDTLTDYPFSCLVECSLSSLAHLVMVPNPEHVPQGDFGFVGDKLSRTAKPRYTYSGIGLYSPALFLMNERATFRLTEVLDPAALAGKLSGELYQGQWLDVGTEERLQRACQLWL